MPLDPELDPHFEEAARLNNLDPMVLRALAMGESSGRAGATSEKGAGGLMQIMPDTARMYGIADPYDPVQAIYGGARILNDNLTKAEALKAGGRDINPAEYALKMYFAGDEGPQWGEKTAAYPGYIAGQYKALLDRQPKPGNATIVDGDMGQPYTPPSGIDRLASVKNFTTPPGVPDRFDNETEAIIGAAAPQPRVQLASAGSNTDVPAFAPGSPEEGVTLRKMAPEDRSAEARRGVLDRSNAYADALANGFQGTIQDFAAGGSAPLKGPDALAAVGKPQQVAQNAAMPSDDEILKMLDEIKPALKPVDLKPSAVGGAQNQAAAPSSAAPSPAFDVKGFVDTYNQYKAIPGAAALANSALQAIMKMAPEAYILNTDGSLVPRPGGPADPKQAQALEAGKTTGQKSAALPYDALLKEIEGNIDLKNKLAENGLRIENGQIIQIPGFNQSVEAKTQAQEQGKVGPAIAQHAGTAAIDVRNEGEKGAAEQFNKSRDEFTANQGATTNLRNFLDAANAVGTGKGTEFSANAAAWLKSAGVDPQKLSLADPAEVEKMRKAATQMIFSQIKGVSSRPAYQEFQMLASANPNPDLQPEANRAIASALLGRMNWENALHEAWDADRRASGRYSNFNFPEWARANPMPGFQSEAYGSVPTIPDRGVMGKNQAPSKPDKSAIEQEMRRRGLLQ